MDYTGIVFGGILVIITVALVIRHARRDKGPHYRPSKSGRSDVLRPRSLTSQIVERSKEKLSRETLGTDATIMFDSNVVLGAVGYDGTPYPRLLHWVEQNRDRVKLCRAVKSEVDLLMHSNGTEQMYQRMQVFEGTELDEPDYKEELRVLEEYQRLQIDELSAVALTWLYEKQNVVKDLLHGQHPVTAPKQYQREALERIYAKASKDREILAKAIALSRESYVTLVTGDQDILVWYGHIPLMRWKKMLIHPPRFVQPGQIDYPEFDSGPLGGIGSG